MPQLSPSMTSGKVGQSSSWTTVTCLAHTPQQVSKWCRQPGEQVALYDILFELETETLTEPQNKLGDMEGSVTMLVEVCGRAAVCMLVVSGSRSRHARLQSQEDVFLQRIIAQEGEECKVGEPVAVACEFEEDLPKLRDYQVPQGQELSKARSLTWQSYLQSGTETSGGCD